MKKIIVAIIMIVAVVSCLCACSSDSEKKAAVSEPGDVVERVLEAVKKGDTKTLERYYDGDADKLDKDKLYEQISGDNEIPDQVKKKLEKLADKVLDYDHKVKETKQEGDTAIVTVEITTYDYSEMVSEILKNVFSELDVQDILESAFSGEDISEDIMEKVYAALGEGVDKLKKKDVTHDVDIVVKKDDSGTWKVQELPEGFGEAILGNLNSELENAFSGFYENLDLSDLFN